MSDAMSKHGWDVGSASSILREYEDLSSIDHPDSIVNTLDPMTFRRDDQVIAIRFFEVDSSEDTSDSIPYEKLNLAAEIISEDMSDIIYDDARAVDSQAVVQAAKAKGYTYVIVLSSQGVYFVNH